MAAAQHEAGRPPSYFERVNVAGTRNLLEAAVSGDVDRFVYASTIGVYGNVSDVVIDNDSPVAPDNHYSRTKLKAEEVVASYGNRLKVTIARISETYGPGDIRLLKLFSGIQKGLFFIIGEGDNQHQLVYIDDLISAIREMATSDAVINQTLILAGDEAISTREMCECISMVVACPLHTLRFPLWPFTAMAFVLEQTFKRMGIQPPLHRRRLEFFRKSYAFSSNSRNRLLEWRPAVSFAEGTALTAKWYREQSLLPAIKRDSMNS